MQNSEESPTSVHNEDVSMAKKSSLCSGARREFEDSDCLPLCCSKALGGPSPSTNPEQLFNGGPVKPPVNGRMRRVFHDDVLVNN